MDGGTASHLHIAAACLRGELAGPDLDFQSEDETMVLPAYLLVIGLVGAFAYGLDVRRWPDATAPARIARVWAFLLVFRLGALVVSHFAREGGNTLVVLSYFLVILGWPELGLLHEFRSTSLWPLVVVAGIMAGTLLWSLLVVLVMSAFRR